jgi:hypothetical protein
MSWNPKEIQQMMQGNFGRRLIEAAGYLYRIVCVGLATVLIFYFSLIISSNPVSQMQAEKIERAIKVLEAKGFEREVLLLRRATLFRNTDNWLNALVDKENAYASTNCPFGIITIYPDFYHKAVDDTERAMILLHEAQHLQGASEAEAYAYVWRSRENLGWTILPYGATETYVTIELQTREFAPSLFDCPENLWNDCTANLRASRLASER